MNPHPTIESAVPRLLLVDDESAVRNALARALRHDLRDRVAIETCGGALLALRRLTEKPFDVLISDLRMPSIDGMSLLEQAARIQPDCLRIILTATADFETARRAVNDFGIFRYLTKPWDPRQLCEHVKDALAIVAARRGEPVHGGKAAKAPVALAGPAGLASPTPQDAEASAVQDLVWPTIFEATVEDDAGTHT